MKEQEKLVVKIRPALEGDVAFVFNSWLKSFRNTGLSRSVQNEVYFSEQHKLIERLLKESTTVVACNPTKPEDIFGWACFQWVDGIFVLHYVYVKHLYRNLGLANELLAESAHDFSTAGLYTHWTHMALLCAAKKNLLYHPYILINYVNKNKPEVA